MCHNYILDGALVFAEGEVTCIGQVIGMVVAEDKDTAQRAALAVAITYEDLPSIITIEVNPCDVP